MKKVVGGGGEKGKVRVRFFEIEMEGETEALQDSVRALTTALNRPTPSRFSAQPIVEARQTAQQMIEGPIYDEDLEPDGEEPAQATEQPGTQKSTRQRARRTPPTPQVLNDLGFDEGTPTWPEFAAAKAPDNDVAKVSVVAAWFKRVKSIDTITIDHAYTAFKYVEWPTPDDIGQAFRNAKRKTNSFGTDGDGKWAINIIGLNRVDKMGKEAVRK